MQGEPVAGEPSQVYYRAAELLADGQWHDYKEIIRKTAIVVPPGVAIRKIETIRRASARKHARQGSEYVDPETRRIEREDSRLIELGATAMTRQILSGSTLFEIQPRGALTKDGPKRIRIKPGKKVIPRPEGYEEEPVQAPEPAEARKPKPDGGQAGQSAKIRAWAFEQGYEVTPRGRLRTELFDLYFSRRKQPPHGQ